MRSVRIDPELDSRLRQASKASGETVSDIVRHAAQRACDEILGNRLLDRISDIVGSVRGGGDARNVSSDFKRILKRTNGKRK